jgi:hypothetical protein
MRRGRVGRRRRRRRRRRRKSLLVTPLRGAVYKLLNKNVVSKILDHTSLYLQLLFITFQDVSDTYSLNFIKKLKAFQ